MGSQTIFVSPLVSGIQEKPSPEPSKMEPASQRFQIYDVDQCPDYSKEFCILYNLSVLMCCVWRWIIILCLMDVQHCYKGIRLGEASIPLSHPQEGDSGSLEGSQTISPQISPQESASSSPKPPECWACFPMLQDQLTFQTITI